jgi:hypothetical protein
LGNASVIGGEFSGEDSVQWFEANNAFEYIQRVSMRLKQRLR